ncbi:MAG: LacI family transcriptional regulator [Firmicutes bacterium]|nr:LacI family transcriptional regulator [Bacillota bacterium]
MGSPPRKPSKATLKDVARKAGPSIATASVVLSQSTSKYVSEELRRRVLEAARYYNYRPNLSARRMKGKNGRSLAILVPQFENFFFNRIVIGAENYANAREYILSIYSTLDEEEKEIRFIENLISSGVDGVLISPSRYERRSVALLKELGIPYVVVDRPVAGVEHDQVVVDNYEAAYKGTKYLLQNGHRRLALFGWKSDLSTITDRIKGFRAAVAEAGLAPAEVAVYETERTREAGYELALRVLRQRRFTAIFAAYHPIAEGIVDALHTLKIKVPDEISLLIYGNPTWASITTPRYSCLVQPDLEVGQKAAELIIERLENPDRPYEQHVLPTRLEIRESVKYLTPVVL